MSLLTADNKLSFSHTSCWPQQSAGRDRTTEISPSVPRCNDSHHWRMMPAMAAMIPKAKRESNSTLTGLDLGDGSEMKGEGPTEPCFLGMVLVVVIIIDDNGDNFLCCHYGLGCRYFFLTTGGGNIGTSDIGGILVCSPFL